MFVVDDLVGWLVGRLADAGYQKLITRVRGSDQERALKEAAAAAVRSTLAEIGVSGGVESDRAAARINKAFCRWEPVPLLPGRPTLLEALQAGIARQFSVLGDAGLPSSLPGVTSGELAGRLTVHLVQQIMIRGSQGGPLTALADQLNHDLTHLQGQRLEGMLAQLLDRLGEAPDSTAGPAGLVGWPLAVVRDPFALEVHRPVKPAVPEPEVPVLPVYVERDHDVALAAVVNAATAGTSGIAALVGGSSTGKTRACWQTLELLRGLEPTWRLWHPIDPQGALAGLPSVGPRTVVWLNEAQRHLDTDDGTGEQVAARLRQLLDDRARGPVLVLATLWPQFWDKLTVRPEGREDPHAQARELLADHAIAVPPAFPVELVRQLQDAEDPRLAQAAAESHDGQVIQYLAGAPELLKRYQHAPMAARALIDTAMDASRLGMRAALPRRFLETAAPGYLTDADWHLQPSDWLEQALDYTAKPAKGVRGPLTPIRPRPAPDASASPLTTGSAWQLADYLDQHGRRARYEVIPPASFWDAAASHADPADLANLGKAAEDRGLYRTAACLYKQATPSNATAGARLCHLFRTLHPTDKRPADWAAAHASLDDPSAVDDLNMELRNAGAGIAVLASRAATRPGLDNPYTMDRLLRELHEAGAARQAATLADRAAAHASLNSPHGVAHLLKTLRRVGTTTQVTTLADRAAAHASLNNPKDLKHLLFELHNRDTMTQLTTLADRAAAHASLDDPGRVADLLIALSVPSATSHATTPLADRAAAHASLDDLDGVTFLVRALRDMVGNRHATTLADRATERWRYASLDDPFAVAHLLFALRKLPGGAISDIAALADRAAAHISLDNPAGVGCLLDALSAAGATGQATALAARAAAHTNLSDPHGVGTLLHALHRNKATAQTASLLDRDPAAHASLNNPKDVSWLLNALREVGATAQASALASRAAAHASLNSPYGVAHLLWALLGAEATAQVTTLLDRDPAAHASLNNPKDVSWLLNALRKMGATAQVTTLADRAAIHVNLNDPGGVGVSYLLDALRAAGARAQAAKLIDRLPAAGLFNFIHWNEGGKEQFRFGREADGCPATPWAWTDLD